MSENTENSQPQENSQDNIKDKGTEPFDEAQAINAEPHSPDTERAVTTWKPEDAANFFAKAINESQKPLAKALARPSVPAGIVWLIVIVLALFIGGLLFRLHKLQQKNEEIVDKKINRNVVVQDEDNIRKVESVIGNLVKQLNKDKVKEAEKDELENRLEDLSHTLKETMLELEEKEDELKEKESQLVRAEKSKDSIAAAGEKIEKLAIELEELRQEKDNVEKLKNREAKANKLLLNQLDAQREAIAALQKQLDAADKLAKTLQGHDIEEKKPEDKADEKEAKPAPAEEKETKTKQDNADLEGMM
ncbi:MAG: hypothetical protein ACYTFY_07680 [Planctomycetota bacterium]|jgi:septal ring factor EnvC (AmiA/AmiB activator)